MLSYCVILVPDRICSTVYPVGSRVSVSAASALRAHMADVRRTGKAQPSQGSRVGPCEAPYRLLGQMVRDTLQTFTGSWMACCRLALPDGCLLQEFPHGKYGSGGGGAYIYI